jgi:aspartyl-tRNA(Asn)/glutamyl-tRNA(Gln) amidotransferase subunit A
MLLGVLAGADPRDSTSVEQPVPPYTADLEKPVENLRIGVVPDYLSKALDPEIRQALLSAQGQLEKAGAEIVEVRLPHSEVQVDGDGNISSYAVACYYIIAMAEASSNLSRYDGVHYGHRTARPAEDIIQLYSKSRSEGFGEEVQRRVMLGTFALSSGYYDAYYLKALKVRRLIREDFDRAFESCDVLLTPVTPTPPFKIGANTEDPLTMYLQDVYTLSLNLAGLPGMAMPCGITETGLPIGMQLMGPVFSEERLLKVGRMFELVSGLGRLTPPELEEVGS